MRGEELYRAIGQTEEDLLERSEQNKTKRRRPLWFSAVAAVLALAVAGGSLLAWGDLPFVTRAYAVEQAVYPDMAPYPSQWQVNFEEAYDAWQASVQKQRQPAGYADGLQDFFASSVPVFLSGPEGTNQVYSPLNGYMALGMLAELTGGSSRQQILDLLGAESIQALRTQAHGVWNGHYRSDGATTSILASSLWLNETVSFVPETIRQLSETYYASVFQGEMGSKGLDRAYRSWLDRETGGLLEDQVKDLSLDPGALLTLATTVRYEARWAQTFAPEDTEPGTFHALSGDMTCDFMHSSDQGHYYWGEGFGAVSRRLDNDGGTMWLILPDEGVTVQELLQNKETMDFLLTGDEWENQKYLTVHLALPKFDVSSQIDLTDGLQTLGVTQVFDPAQADFSPMTTDSTGIALSQARHGVRVAVDEEGVTAAAYTVMANTGAGAPPEDEISFTLDRPFLFAITSSDGLPLFVGSVYQPVA